MIELTAAQAVERVRAGELSPAELFEAYRERAAAEELNAFLWVADERARPPRRTPLSAACPLAVKDLFCVEGVPSAAASRILEGHRPAYTATSVRKLAEAGAPMLGKTNMDEFAMGSSNENSGFGPVKNPWDRERVPGGSSGGSAAAVAAGLAPWAIGTDTGGSIRQPASLCGLVGLKPTYGAVSRYGMIAFASSLDQAGPLTRDVKDAALLFRHMVGRDPCDSTSLDFPGELTRAHRRATRRHPLRPARQPHRRRRGAGGARGLREHAAKIEELGGEVEQIELPNADHGLSAYYLLAPAEASANLARYDGVRFGMRSGQRGPAEHVRGHPRRRLRRRGQAPHHARHLRAVLGLLRRPLRQGPAGAHQDRRGLRERVREGRRDRHPDLAQRGLQARRAHRRPVLDVPVRLLHRADVAGRHPGAVDPRRACPRACRWASSWPGPRSRRASCSTPATRWSRPSASTGARPVAEPAHNLEPVIGLEIHVQLRTRTKMFCGCALSFGDEPNTHTCPICLGHPGTLPVTNEQAVRYGLMIGLALGCTPAERSIFHRKNYFYPDLPKGYQISQFDIPLCRDGRLGDVRIHRVHLEEDAAKLTHAGASGRIHGAEASVVDFNRGGTPLVEIVTEPDLRSAEEAAEWARLLRATLKRLGVSDVNMEEGSLRVDANVSVRPAGEDVLGTKTELKNMNSFTFLRRGVEAEIARQTEPGRWRGAGRAGDAPLRPAQRKPDLAALQGGVARLPLLPRARPGGARARARAARRDPRGDPRAAGRARGAAEGRARAARGDRAPVRLPHRAGRPLRGGAGRRRPAHARQLGQERPGAPARATASPRTGRSRRSPWRRC